MMSEAAGLSEDRGLKTSGLGFKTSGEENE